MKAFQILNKEGIAISINKLDEEVCAIVGVEVHPKDYCKLGKREEYKTNFDYICVSNWFDTIGWDIAQGLSFQDILDKWSDVMKEFIGQTDEQGNIITLETCIPYQYKVLNSWIEKGYQPISVDE